MQYEDSYGAVVFTREQGKILYAIIQALEGWYGFSKGHPDPGEAEKEAALREIQEETGLTPEIIGDFKTVDEHPIPGKKRCDQTDHLFSGGKRKAGYPDPGRGIAERSLDAF